jgi:hypothetical protein
LNLAQLKQKQASIATRLVPEKKKKLGEQYKRDTSPRDSRSTGGKGRRREEKEESGEINTSEKQRWRGK